jgi:hypothetical protein
MRASVRKGILFSVLAGTVALVVLDSGEDKATRRISPAGARPGGGSEVAASSQSAAPAGNPGRFELPDRPSLGEPRTDLFGSPPPPKTSAVVAAPGPPPAPVAPTNPYKFAGRLVRDGRAEFFLSKGDSVLSVQQGEMIEGGYRVEAIGEEQITLMYLPLGKKETIPVYSSLPPAAAGAQARPAPAQAASPAKLVPVPPRPVASAASAAQDSAAIVITVDLGGESKPARLLWHGPDQVKLGTQFTVALHVTSAQPVRASPMQIKVNPALFETVAVKPGRFFAQGDRSFTYRIDPDGSIFIGASNSKPIPAEAAEFVVLTLKPLKPAPAAELSVASLSLHGPAGKVIAFDPLVAFKTAITP